MKNEWKIGKFIISDRFLINFFKSPQLNISQSSRFLILLLFFNRRIPQVSASNFYDFNWLLNKLYILVQL